MSSSTGAALKSLSNRLPFCLRSVYSLTTASTFSALPSVATDAAAYCHQLGLPIPLTSSSPKVQDVNHGTTDAASTELRESGSNFRRVMHGGEFYKMNQEFFSSSSFASRQIPRPSLPDLSMKLPTVLPRIQQNGVEVVDRGAARHVVFKLAAPEQVQILALVNPAGWPAADPLVVIEDVYCPGIENGDRCKKW